MEMWLGIWEGPVAFCGSVLPIRGSKVAMQSCLLLNQLNDPLLSAKSFLRGKHTHPQSSPFDPGDPGLEPFCTQGRSLTAEVSPWQR